MPVLLNDGQIKEPVAATIGVFDGVHRGHRFVLSQLVAKARERGLNTVVITFRRHPLCVVRKDFRQQLLMGLDDRLAAIESMGIDYVVALDFTEDMSRMTAGQFLDFIHRHYSVRMLLTGYDNKFGSSRSDTFEDYVKYGKTGRDGATFRFYKDEVSEENLLYDTGAIVQQDEAEFVSIDVTDVQKLIMTADKGNSNSDDCIDWADAKIYMKSEVQEPLDTDILEYMIEIASTADTSGVIDTVVQKFNEAYASAQDILEKAKAGDPSITQDMVDSSWQELMSIMHYLSFKQGDKTDLEKVITMAEELDLDRYLAAGKDAFEAALTNAQNVMGDGDAMQDEVDQAWKELLRAMSELRLKPDKSALEDLISQAQGLDAEDYEAGSFSAMLSVLAEVQAVYDNPEAAQEEVETAEAELQAALDQLAAKADDTEEPAAPADPGDAEKPDDTPEADTPADQDTAEKADDSQQTDDGQNPAGGSQAGNSSAVQAENTKASVNNAAKTGDNMSFIFWGTAVVLAAGAAALAVRRKKED